MAINEPVIVNRLLGDLDELILCRSEASAAHAFLDAQGVPRYAQTDYPLPLAQRIRYLVELGPKATG